MGGSLMIELEILFTMVLRDNAVGTTTVLGKVWLKVCKSILRSVPALFILFTGEERKH
jgi:hypothetical protein